MFALLGFKDFIKLLTHTTNNSLFDKEVITWTRTVKTFPLELFRYYVHFFPNAFYKGRGENDVQLPQI